MGGSFFAAGYHVVFIFIYPDVFRLFSRHFFHAYNGEKSLPTLSLPVGKRSEVRPQTIWRLASPLSRGEDPATPVAGR